jgi:hypothetical protein
MIAQHDGGFQIVINCILHAAILMTILGVFFINYISPVEDKQYRKEISSIFNHELTSSLDKLTGVQKQIALKSIDQMPMDSLKKIFSEKSKEVQVNNQWLQITIWSVVAFLYIVLAALLILYYTHCGSRFNFGHILLENIIIFLCVGAIELSFFMFIASRYIPVDPSLIAVTFVETIKKSFNQ